MTSETIQWITDGSLPDAEITVLAVADEEVHEAFHDGEVWRWANAEAIRHQVTAWADMPTGPGKEDQPQ